MPLPLDSSKFGIPVLAPPVTNSGTLGIPLNLPNPPFPDLKNGSNAHL